MARSTLYLETSVIGYATSRLSRDLIVAARQQLTQEWFATRAADFELFVSQLVQGEASAGDPDAAREREVFMRGVPVIAVTSDAGGLAAELVAAGAVPEKAAEDALHVAVAAVHGIEYLLTWNCKHIANAALRQAIERVCMRAGFVAPVICTPAELMDDG